MTPKPKKTRKKLTRSELSLVDEEESTIAAENPPIVGEGNESDEVELSDNSVDILEEEPEESKKAKGKHSRPKKKIILAGSVSGRTRRRIAQSLYANDAEKVHVTESKSTQEQPVKMTRSKTLTQQPEHQERQPTRKRKCLTQPDNTTKPKERISKQVVVTCPSQKDKMDTYKSNLVCLVHDIQVMNFTPEQKDALEKYTPFWNIINTVNVASFDTVMARKSDVLIREIIKTFNQKNKKFFLGKKFRKLTSKDFTKIFQISGGNTPINLIKHREVTSELYIRRFSKCGRNLLKSTIKGALDNALEGKKATALEDVPRLMTLFMLVSLFVTNKCYSLTWGYLTLTMDLEKMKTYDWSEHFCTVLINSINENLSKLDKITGCVPALQYWVMEMFHFMKPADETAEMLCKKWDVHELIKLCKDKNIKDLCIEKAMAEEEEDEMETDGKGKKGSEEESTSSKTQKGLKKSKKSCPIVEMRDGEGEEQKEHDNGTKTEEEGEDCEEEPTKRKTQKRRKKAKKSCPVDQLTDGTNTDEEGEEGSGTGRLDGTSQDTEETDDSMAIDATPITKNDSPQFVAETAPSDIPEAISTQHLDDIEAFMPISQMILAAKKKTNKTKKSLKDELKKQSFQMQKEITGSTPEEIVNSEENEEIETLEELEKKLIIAESNLADLRIELKKAYEDQEVLEKSSKILKSTIDNLRAEMKKFQEEGKRRDEKEVDINSLVNDMRREINKLQEQAKRRAEKDDETNCFVKDMENEIKNLQASNARLLDVATNIKETKVVHEGTKEGKSSTFVDRGEKTDVELPEEFNSNLIDSVTSIAKSYLPELTEDDDIIANTQEIKDLSLLTQEFVEITKPYEFEVAFEKERSKKLENFKQKVYKEKLEKDEHITKFTQEYSEIVEPNPIEKEIMDTGEARLRRFKKDNTIGGRRKFVAITSNKEKLNCMSKLKREDRKSPQKYSPPVVKKSKGAETTVLQQKDKKTSKDKEDEQPSFDLHISQF